MTAHTSQARVVGLLIAFSALAALVGCGGPDVTYKGGPSGFSTHSYVITYPKTFENQSMPQMSADEITLRLLVQTEAPAAQASEQSPTPMGTITVRCQRWRRQETAQTFMERFFDDRAPRYIDLKMRQVGRNPDALEWEVTAPQAAFASRVILLPKERLAYSVETRCRPDRIGQFEAVFARARSSFRVLPAR